MTDLTPTTPHQEDALRSLYQRFAAGDNIVSLTGLAGTGKTHILPHLKRILPYEITICAPTHRAAMILRRKGLQADTLHAACLVPIFTQPYNDAVAWCTTVGTLGDDEPTPEQPALIAWAGIGVSTLRQWCRQYEAGKALRACGINAMDYLAGYGPKPPQPGLLAIDESSMVGQELLSLATQVYRKVLLVGDPGQLPPVKDIAVLDQYNGARLTEIHRQAQDSAIVRLAYDARHGIPVWRRTLSSYAPEVATYDRLPASALLTNPLIVWRNATRLNVTQATRTALRYPPHSLVEGEPLICRATDKNLRLLGLYNNAMFRVAKVHGPREVTLTEELSGKELDDPVLCHLEEVDGAAIDPEAVPMRWGYSMTAHTAQGGEWPTVYISVPDLQAYASMAGRTGAVDDLSRWTYTSITRAKEHLGLLTTHTLTRG